MPGKSFNDDQTTLRINLAETVDVRLCFDLDRFVACGLVLAGVGGQTEVDVSVKDLPPGTLMLSP